MITYVLLDTDSQGSGVYMPEMDELEHCNAHNTALYELHTLRVRTFASSNAVNCIIILFSDNGILTMPCFSTTSTPQYYMGPQAKVLDSSPHSQPGSKAN